MRIYMFQKRKAPQKTEDIHRQFPHGPTAPASDTYTQRDPSTQRSPTEAQKIVSMGPQNDLFKGFKPRFNSGDASMASFLMHLRFNNYHILNRKNALEMVGIRQECRAFKAGVKLTKTAAGFAGTPPRLQQEIDAEDMKGIFDPTLIQMVANAETLSGMIQPAKIQSLTKDTRPLNTQSFAEKSPRLQQELESMAGIFDPSVALLVATAKDRREFALPARIAKIQPCTKQIAYSSNAHVKKRDLKSRTPTLAPNKIGKLCAPDEQCVKQRNKVANAALAGVKAFADKGQDIAKKRISCAPSNVAKPNERVATKESVVVAPGNVIRPNKRDAAAESALVDISDQPDKFVQQRSPLSPADQQIFDAEMKKFISNEVSSIKGKDTFETASLRRTRLAEMRFKAFKAISEGKIIEPELPKFMLEQYFTRIALGTPPRLKTDLSQAEYKSYTNCLAKMTYEELLKLAPQVGVECDGESKDSDYMIRMSDTRRYSCSLCNDGKTYSSGNYSEHRLLHPNVEYKQTKVSKLSNEWAPAYKEKRTSQLRALLSSQECCLKMLCSTSFADQQTLAWFGPGRNLLSPDKRCDIDDAVSQNTQQSELFKAKDMLHEDLVASIQTEVMFSELHKVSVRLNLDVDSYTVVRSSVVINKPFLDETDANYDYFEHRNQSNNSPAFNFSKQVTDIKGKLNKRQFKEFEKKDLVQIEATWDAIKRQGELSRPQRN